MMKRTSRTILQRLHELASARSGKDWWLVFIVGGILSLLLVSITLITPYRTSSEPLYYKSDSAVGTRYIRAEIIQPLNDGNVQVRLLDGAQKGQKVTAKGFQGVRAENLKKGEVVIVGDGTNDASRDMLYFVDRFRMPGILLLSVVLVALVTIIGGRRGILSVAGLIVSLLVIGWFIVPLVISGYDPFLIILAGSYIIGIVAVLMSHGMRRRTFISIGCICLILTIVALMVQTVMWGIAFTGVADEGAFYLSINNQYLDMGSLVAGGMIIATLGVLDDVVTTQVATVEELHKANSRASGRTLFLSASSVGSDHIASIINTLALAYAGASLPLLLILAKQSSSLFMILNSEYIAVEIVRTLVASIGLIIAIPISTAIATLLYKREYSRGKRPSRIANGIIKS